MKHEYNGFYRCAVIEILYSLKCSFSDARACAHYRNIFTRALRCRDITRIIDDACDISREKQKIANGKSDEQGEGVQGKLIIYDDSRQFGRVISMGGDEGGEEQ